MRTVPVPTFTQAGWVTNVVDKLDFLATYVFLADKSQTTTYGNKITSVPWLIQEYGKDLDSLTQQMTVSLQEYFSRYFDTAAVSVKRSSYDDPVSNSVELSIVVDVVDKGIRYSLANSVRMVNSKFMSYAKLNNYGE